ncbi:alpha/beta fold hydrolase [Actinoplanes couchii]|uniref:Hydrolase n=1 Tax=Actinoplanes couchii TaxID=403638 RepID=A0ABQ3XF36_9ACTN|nr:alpha/beta hydrolase [Actinoplanes couchii]MDR6321945.1 pimeloyl-ACP methyl ester carboxylesterase [Actinoplanes couchii]GID57098.1 hydrolase [Actinoplanes couchii]
MTLTLDAPGAVIAYDVHEPAAPSDTTPLLLIGSPMDASGFVTLAGHFTDRRVITYDPRGTGRSTRTDPAPETTPEQHADDVRRVIEAAGGGPVDLFASSGGAVNSLALVAAHPELVRTLVAHEPPVVRLLDEAVDAEAAVRGIRDLYERFGVGPAMVKFIEIVSFQGPIPPGFADEPGADPATFGLPSTDDGSRDDVLLGQNLVTCCLFEPDFAALKSAGTRILVGVGAESEGELAHRAGRAVAARLGADPVVFPSNHAGFLGGEYGQHGDPVPFAAKLHEVLD